MYDFDQLDIDNFEKLERQRVRKVIGLRKTESKWI